MFNHECLSTTVVTKAITWAWVFVTSVYFIGSFAYPYLDQKNLTAAYANGRAAGQQETYNAAMQTFSGNTFQNGQKVGSTETITQLVNMLGKQIDGGCKEAIPVPLPNGTGSVGILSVPCYQMIQQATAKSGQAALQGQSPQPEAPAHK